MHLIRVRPRLGFFESISRRRPDHPQSDDNLNAKRPPVLAAWPLWSDIRTSKPTFLAIKTMRSGFLRSSVRLCCVPSTPSQHPRHPIPIKKVSPLSRHEVRDGPRHPRVAGRQVSRPLPSGTTNDQRKFGCLAVLHQEPVRTRSGCPKAAITGQPC